jgi:RNA polymerase sigma factor (sigma-70 family)
VSEIDPARALDWAEIYDRLAADRGDELAWVAMASWVSLWANRGRRSIADLGAETVEDVIAETCVCAIEKFDQAYGRETFLGFVLGMYLNIRQKYLRRHRQRLLPIDDRAGEVAAEPDPEPDPPLLELLRACLDGLPPRERRAVELRYFGDAPAVHIAAELGVKLDNARRIVFNGMERLRACVGRAWPGGRKVD